MGPSTEASSKIGAKNMASASTVEDRTTRTPKNAGTTLKTTPPTTSTHTSEICRKSVAKSTESSSREPIQPAEVEQLVEPATEHGCKIAFVHGPLKDAINTDGTAGFTMFLKFPAEIRNMVWQLAATNHRHDPSRLVFLYNCSKIECPAILLVNSEAKDQATKYFQKLRRFKPVREGTFNGTLATKILVNPFRDFVTFLNPNMGSHSASLKRLIYQCTAESIQYLALSSTWVSIFLEDGFFMAAVDNLMAGGNLKGLFVVRQETLNVGKDNVQLVNSNTLADWLYKDSIEAELEEAGERRGWEWNGQLEIVFLEAIPSV